MPPVPADPFIVVFDLLANNAAGTTAASATVAAVQLEFDDAASTLLDVTTLVPTSIGPVPAGGSMTSTHIGFMTMPPVSSPCSLCSNNVTMFVDVNLGTRTERIMFAPMMTSCTF